MSLDLLDRLGVSVQQSVLDVGGGASTLVDHLLARGHMVISVCSDLSEVLVGRGTLTALEPARGDLDGGRSARVAATTVLGCVA